MTNEELAALVDLLNRTPMSQAEKMWMQELINKLSEIIRVEQEKQTDE
jgi:hypothetical protein